MEISISEARKQLPSLIRQVRQNPTTCVHITLHNEVVAELRSAQPALEPGGGAKKLLELSGKRPKPRGPKHHVSSRVKDYLYGSGRHVRS